MLQYDTQTQEYNTKLTYIPTYRMPIHRETEACRRVVIQKRIGLQ